MIKLKELKKNINKYYTNHIAFRVFDLSDMFFLHNASTNKEFTQYLLWENNEDIIDFFKKEIFLDFNNHNNLVVSVLDNKKGTWIGLIKIIPYKDSYALSFWLSKDFWGKGFPLYSINAFINIYFDYMQCETIYALTQKDYVLMRKICQTYNFKLNEESIYLRHENGNDLEFVELEAHRSTFKKLKGDRIYYELPIEKNKNE